MISAPDQKGQFQLCATMKKKKKLSSLVTVLFPPWQKSKTEHEAE